MYMYVCVCINIHIYIYIVHLFRYHTLFTCLSIIGYSCTLLAYGHREFTKGGLVKGGLAMII